MMSNPVVSQPDRDVLEDIGLADVAERDEEPELLSHVERTPS